MPLPFVVVEVPAQGSTAPETAALIEACTMALAGGRCALTPARDEASVSAIAIVSWRDREQLNALVEVARARASTDAWRSEELTFKSEDQRLERFRTLGLAIAALFRGSAPDSAHGQTAEGGQGTRPKDGLTPAPKAPSGRGAMQSARDTSTRSQGADQQPPVPTQEAEAWLGAGPVADYEPELASWRAGGVVTGSVGFRGIPVFLSVFGSYAVGLPRQGVSLSWSTLGAGPGVRWPLSRSLELSGVACGVLVDVSAHASEPGRTSRQNVWVPGAQLAAALGFRVGDALRLSLAVDARQLTGRVVIREHNDPAGTVGKTSLGAGFQLALRLF